MNNETRTKYPMKLVEHQTVLYKLYYLLTKFNAMLVKFLLHLEYRNIDYTTNISKPTTLIIVTITFGQLLIYDTYFFPTLEIKTAQYTNVKC